MRIFMLFVFLLFVNLSIFASPEGATLCFSADSNYQVSLSDDEKRAQVLKEFKAVRFGTLSCSPISPERPDHARLYCHSENVADAGFSAIFFSGDENQPLTVKLSEIWFGGEKLIDKFPCISTYGTLQKRVLWITGESNIVDLDVAAGGEIEVNIRTTSGTGYEWELEPPPLRDTVTLIEGPIFIPGSTLAGGVGVTRFRFRVDEHPNRGFLLNFQLRRPWESTPLKTFFLRFNAMRT